MTCSHAAFGAHKQLRQFVSPVVIPSGSSCNFRPLCHNDGNMLNAYAMKMDWLRAGFPPVVSGIPPETLIPPAGVAEMSVKSARGFTVKSSPIKVNQAASIQRRYGLAPSESDPVRAGQTFEILKNRLPLRRPLFLHFSFKNRGFQGYSRLFKVDFFSPASCRVWEQPAMVARDASRSGGTQVESS